MTFFLFCIAVGKKKKYLAVCSLIFPNPLKGPASVSWLYSIFSSLIPTLALLTGQLNCCCYARSISSGSSIETTIPLTCAVSFSFTEGPLHGCIYSFGLLSRSQSATQGLTLLAPNQRIIGFAYWTSSSNSLQMHLVNEECTQGSLNKWRRASIKMIPMQIAHCGLVIFILLIILCLIISGLNNYSRRLTHLF